MNTVTAQNAKDGLGGPIDLARGDGTVANHGCPVVMVIATEEFEPLKAPDTRPPAPNAARNHESQD
jgi:hypothetical protein